MKTKPTDIINFGKYKGMSFDDIADENPSYILWLSDNVESVNLPKKFLEAVEWDVRDQEDILLDAHCDWYARYM